MTFNFFLLDDFMVYNNSFNFVMKIFGKELPINIFQLEKKIQCSYNCIEYSKKIKYIDSDLKLAMKHFFIQTTVDYLNVINSSKNQNLTINDLGFFSNMLVMKAITSAPSVNLLNLDSLKYEKVQSTFFADKKLSGALANQYLSPITSFIFSDDWNKLSEFAKYDKLLKYDVNFYLEMLNNVNALGEAIWENKSYSDDYNSFDSFLSSFKNFLENQYWVHNYGDFKLYKAPGISFSYPEIYQILYDVKFTFDDTLKINKISFNSLFFENSLINEQNLQNLKTIEEFKEHLNLWREKSEIIEFKKTVVPFLFYINNDKYNIDDFNISDFKDVISKVIKQSNDLNILCSLIVFEDLNFNQNKLKLFFNNNNYPFFYFIPFYETLNNKNIVFFSYYSNLDFDKYFKNCDFYDNSETVVNILCDNVNWDVTDLNNHYLSWNPKNNELDQFQFLVSPYLDFVSGGLVFLLPKTWQI